MLTAPAGAPDPGAVPSLNALRRATRLALLAGAVTVVFWAAAVALPAPFEYAEGDTATWAWLLRHGEPLYGAAAGLPMLRSNYPPLYLALVGALAPSDGAILATGRLVSLAGFALALAMVGVSVAAATGSRRRGALAALLLCATFRAGFWAAVCRGDALALGLGAVGVTLASLRVRGWPWLGALAFSASLLVKHSLVVFPAGVVLFALAVERRRAVVLALATLALVGGVVARAGLWQPIVAGSVAPFRPATLWFNLASAVLPSALGIMLAALLFRRRHQLPERARAVLGPWFAVALVGLLWLPALGRVGATFNYLLELLTALAVLAVVAASTVATAAVSRLFLAHVAVTAVEAIVYVTVYAAVVFPARRVEAVAARAALAGVDGPVLAEQSWYATASGHPPLVIPFLATQLAHGGRWDPAPLVRMAREGRIARVLVGFPLDEDLAAHGLQWHEERFPPGVLEALRDRYRLRERAPDGDLYVYEPR